MIKKTKLLFLCAILIGAAPVLAAETQPKINKSDIDLSLGTELRTLLWDDPYWPTYGGNSFNLFGGAQYFLADGLSAGLEFNLRRPMPRHGKMEIGPVITKYFLTSGRIAPYVSLSPITWSKEEGVKSYFTSGARLGAKFFITDSFAVGPAIEYKAYWGGGRGGEFEARVLGIASYHF